MRKMNKLSELNKRHEKPVVGQNNPNDIDFNMGEIDLRQIGMYLIWASEASELTYILGNGITPFTIEGLATWIEFAPSLAVVG